MTGRFHQVADVPQFAHIVLTGLACMYLVDEVFQQRATDAAGCTETAALVHEETGKVLHHVQQLTRLVEYHERASGGDVFEGNAAAEFRRWNRKTCGPRDLYRLAVSRTAGFQHLL